MEVDEIIAKLDVEELQRRLLGKPSFHDMMSADELMAEIAGMLNFNYLSLSLAQIVDIADVLEELGIIRFSMAKLSYFLNDPNKNK